jgi:type IV secretory pathway VirB2 component (pilin)
MKFFKKTSIKIIKFFFAFIFLGISNSYAIPVDATSNCANTAGGVCNGQTTGSVTYSINGQAQTAINYSSASDCTSACGQAKALIASASALTVREANANISSNSLTRVMCNALRIVQGSAGKTFAAFAIIAVGIGFFSGKVSWGLMIGVAAGIAAMFGAPSIVAAISGQNTDMNCGSQL